MNISDCHLSQKYCKASNRRTNNQELKKISFPVKLQIQLQNGETDYIVPTLGDEPIQLATEFCNKHNLQHSMIDLLISNINESIQKLRNSPTCSYPKIPKVLSRRLNSQSQVQNCPLHQISNEIIKKHSNNKIIGMYQKGIRCQKAKAKWTEKKKQKSMIEQLKQCSHTPQINQISKKIAQNTNYDINLIEKISSRKKYRNSYKSNQQQKQLQQCSFRPIVNLKTKIQYRKTNNNNFKNIFQSLYEDSKSRELKFSQEKSKYNSNTPKINPISKQIVGQCNFYQRMQKYSFQKVMKQEQQKKKNHQINRILYKPKTGKAPKHRNIQKLPIGEYLYSKSQSKEINKQCNSRVTQQNSRSQQLYQKRKLDGFRRLFHKLDDSKCGLLSIINVNLLGLTVELLRILNPLLEELEIMGVELDQSEFIKSMENFFKTLNPHQKNVIINCYSKNIENTHNNQNYHYPTINYNSRKIAQEMQRSQMNIYDYCEVKQNVREQQLDTQRVQQTKRQMEQCTFQPKLIRSRYYN